MNPDFSNGIDIDEARRAEEQSTARRAEVLHAAYIDTSQMSEKP